MAFGGCCFAKVVNPFYEYLGAGVFSAAHALQQSQAGVGRARVGVFSEVCVR